MRIGILTDLHLGDARGMVWHNRQMHANARQVLRATVEQLNKEHLDRVLVLGDVTESGLEEELRAALEILSGLKAPWWVIPGNHDHPAIASGLFERVFTAHVPGAFQRMGEYGLLYAREHVPSGDTPVPMRLEWDGLDAAIRATSEVTVLLVCTHYPLLPTEEHARRYGGRYGGHFEDGLVLVDRLRQASGCLTVLLCGHQHWHHVLHPRGFPPVIQCATASLIEYPMECRLLNFNAYSFSTFTLPTASPGPAAESLIPGTEWVRGVWDEDNYSLELS